MAEWREAVFSSSGFRIRSAQSHAADHRFARWAKQAAASLFFAFFPADCRLCGSPLIEVSRLPVCKSCLNSIHSLQGSFCSVCGEALLSPLFADRTDALCGLCQRAHPPFHRAIAYGSYEGGLKELIHLLKFEQVRPAARVLGRMLAEALARLEPQLPQGTISIVPVPLHKRKQAERGFNQAELVAKAALKKLAMSGRFELTAGVLVRRRETASQIGLTSHQRRENLRGAFAVVDPTQVAGKNILLVDDVLTTGTTASECAKVLRRAGALGVWVVTIARTLKMGEALAPNFQEGENEERRLVAANA